MSRIDKTHTVVASYAYADIPDFTDDPRHVAQASVVEATLGQATHKESYDILVGTGIPLAKNEGICYRCDLCGNVYDQSLVVYKNGRHYCTVLECAEERA